MSLKLFCAFLLVAVDWFSICWFREAGKKSFFTEARKPKVIFRHLCRGIFTLGIIFTKNVRHNPLLSRWGEIRNIGIFYHLRQFPNVLLNFVGLLATHEGRWNEWKIPWKNIEFPSSVGKSLHAAPNFLLISPYRYVTFMFIHNHHFLFLVLIFFPARNFRIFFISTEMKFPLRNTFRLEPKPP